MDSGGHWRDHSSQGSISGGLHAQGDFDFRMWQLSSYCFSPVVGKVRLVICSVSGSMVLSR